MQIGVPLVRRGGNRPEAAIQKSINYWHTTEYIPYRQLDRALCHFIILEALLKHWPKKVTPPKLTPTVFLFHQLFTVKKLKSSLSYIILCVCTFKSSLSWSDQSCTDLAKIITYNQTQSYSQEEQRNINRAGLCTQQYKSDSSARAMSIETSYKFFSGGVSGTETQIQQEQSKQCGSTFGDYWQNKITSESARETSTDALAVIDNCQILTANNMTPSLTINTSGSEFTLTLRWNPAVRSNLELYHVGPSNFTGYDCNASVGSGKDFAFKPIKASSDIRTTLSPPQAFVLSCVRPSSTIIRDGENLDCYKEAILNITSNGPTATLKLPQRCVSNMPGERAAAIEKKLKNNEEALNASRASIEELRIQTTQRLDDLSTRSGQYQGELAQRAKLVWKGGNNGTVTCTTYCAGDYGGWRGTCVSGRDDNTKQPLFCESDSRNGDKSYSCLCSTLN